MLHGHGITQSALNLDPQPQRLGIGVLAVVEPPDIELRPGQFIATLEKRQGLKVACPEEIAYRSGWIDAAQLETLAAPMLKNSYGQYLMRVLREKVF